MSNNSGVISGSSFNGGGIPLKIDSMYRVNVNLKISSDFVSISV
jgi:hypothetical protein